MSVKVVYNGPKLSIELEGENQSELWKKLADFQETFEEPCCGKCKKSNLRFTVRTVDDNAYHELRCLDCGAKLAFGQHKKGGGLYPSRKDKDTGKIKGTNGWVKWNSETQKEE